MMILECDNPHCKKRTRVRHGFSVVREQHFVMRRIFDRVDEHGKLTERTFGLMGDVDPSYPIEELTRPPHEMFMMVQSRLPEGWLAGLVGPLDFGVFCSGTCLTEMVPSTPDSGETPESRAARVQKSIEEGAKP